MILLAVVSLIWAFSFGLIKGNLTGLDSGFVSACRMAISLAVFLPFLRLRGLRLITGLRLVAIGAVQFGVMYVCYIQAYQYLDGHQVAICTIFTPLYVTLVDDLLEHRFRLGWEASALLAVGGAYVALGGGAEFVEVRDGFFLLQAANLCFAAGQVFYRRIRRAEPELHDSRVFGLLYLGAFAVTALWTLATVDLAAVTLEPRQALTLLYLGMLASGVCFFLWNVGATKTSAGMLAVMNNLKIPLAVACSLLFFGEQADAAALVLGGLIIAAALGLNAFLARRPSGRSSRPTGK